MIVTATPFSKDSPVSLLVICTVNRSHWLTSKSATTNVQQFGVVGLFGPVTVAMIPVTAKVFPQFVLLRI
jgi:hypothetical protein